MSTLYAQGLWQRIGWVLVVTVIVLSLVRVPANVSVEGADKVQHVLAYFTLMYWWGMTRPDRQGAWLLFLPSMGLALEGSQSMLAWRSMEWFDAAANLAGVLLGWLVLRTPARRLLGRLDQVVRNRLDTGLP